MNVFEILLSDQSIENTVVEDHQVEPWKMIFATADLTQLFDMTPAGEAVPIIDAAVARLTSQSEEIREAITPLEKLGVRGYRTRLLAMRRSLIAYPEARISGLLVGE